MAQVNSGYTRRIGYEFSSDTVADGNYDFNVGPGGPLNNIVDYFYFVNASGDQVDATDGTVTISLSSGADIFQSVSEGVFQADVARSADRAKPNGIGTAEILRINLSGIMGASGFQLLYTQFAT